MSQEAQIPLPLLPSHFTPSPPNHHLHHLWSAPLAVRQPTSPPTKSYPRLVSKRRGIEEIICQGWQPRCTGTITILSQALDVRPAAPLFHHFSRRFTWWSSHHRVDHRALFVLQRSRLGDLKPKRGVNCVQWSPGNMKQQAVNITQLVLSEHPQGWTTNRAPLLQMSVFSCPFKNSILLLLNVILISSLCYDPVRNKSLTVFLFLLLSKPNSWFQG